MTNKNRLVFCSSLLALVKVQFLYDKNNCFISRKYLHPYNDIFFSKDKKYSRVLYVSTLEYVLLYSRVTHTHTTTTDALPKNTDTMISPARRLLAAPNLQVSAIAIRRAIDIDHRNTAMQFFYVKITFSLFYCLLFYRPLTGVHGDKRYVF